MNRIARPFIACAVFALMALLVIAANPAFQDFNTNQFGVAGNKVAIKSAPWITNLTAAYLTNLHAFIDDRGQAAFGASAYYGATTLTVANNPAIANNTTLGIVGGTLSYVSVNWEDNQPGQMNFALYCGYPYPGIFTMREAGVANRLSILKTSGYIGIGTTNPGTRLHVVTDYNTILDTEPHGVLAEANDDTAHSSHFEARKSRGTYYAPLAIWPGDYIAGYTAQGYNGAGFERDGYLAWVTTITNASGHTTKAVLAVATDGVENETYVFDTNGFTFPGGTHSAAVLTTSATTNSPAANEFVTARWVSTNTAGSGQFTNALQALTWLSFDTTAGSGLTNVIVDFTKGNEFALILTTNAFFATPTNRPATNFVMSGMIRIYQDAVGVRSVSFTNGATTGAWKTPGAQLLTVTTNAEAGSLISYTLGDYGTNQWYVWGLNFQ